jgi:hypothetical protein
MEIWLTDLRLNWTLFRTFHPLDPSKTSRANGSALIHRDRRAETFCIVIAAKMVVAAQKVLARPSQKLG